MPCNDVQYIFFPIEYNSITQSYTAYSSLKIKNFVHARKFQLTKQNLMLLGNSHIFILAVSQYVIGKQPFFWCCYRNYCIFEQASFILILSFKRIFFRITCTIDTVRRRCSLQRSDASFSDCPYLITGSLMFFSMNSVFSTQVLKKTCTIHCQQVKNYIFKIRCLLRLASCMSLD